MSVTVKFLGFIILPLKTFSRIMSILPCILLNFGTVDVLVIEESVMLVSFVAESLLLFLAK